MKQHGWFNGKDWLLNNPCDIAEEWFPAYMEPNAGVIPDENYEPLGYMLPHKDTDRATGQIIPPEHDNPSIHAIRLYKYRTPPIAAPADEMQEQLNAARECIELLNERIIALTARADNMDVVTARRAMEVAQMATRFDVIGDHMTLTENRFRNDLDTLCEKLNRQIDHTPGTVPEHFHADMTGQPRPEPGYSALTIGQKVIIAGNECRVFQIDEQPNNTFRVTFRIIK